MVAEALVGACDDGVADGLAFCAVRVEEGGGSVAFDHGGDFPGEIEGVLDAGVGAEAVEGWVTMDCVTEAKAILRQCGWVGG